MDGSFTEVGVIVVIIGFYILVNIFFPNILILPGVLSISPVLAIPPVAGLLFGLPGAVAAGLGYGLFAIMSGGLNPINVVGIGSTIILGYSAHRYWGSLPSSITTGKPPGNRSVKGIVESLVVCTLAVIVVTPIFAWGDALQSTRPFFVGAVVTFSRYLVSFIVFGIPLLLIIGPNFHDLDIDPFVARTGLPKWVPIVGIGWIVVGSIGSIGFRLFALVPDREYLVRDVGFLLVLDNQLVFGYLGWKVQLVLGAMFLTLLLLGIIFGDSGA